MADAGVGDDRRVLALSPEEREARDLSADDVRDALRGVLSSGSPEEKVIEGCTLPAIDFDYETVDSDERHPLVFRNCTVGHVSARHADVRLPLRFEDSTLGGLTLDGATVETDLAVVDSTVTGPVRARETRFRQDADFARTAFEGPVDATEAWFGDDTAFADATFEDGAAFRGASFHGSSNRLDDNADFSGVTFESAGDFHQATFEFTTFEDAQFAESAEFQEVRFAGDADFTAAAFDADAGFDEATFGEDASFEGAVFDGPAVFRGTAFEGGARTLQDDATFADAEFRDAVNFRSARFRYASFEAVAFDDHAMFEEARFGEADFPDAAFDGEADFDETRFAGDADFTGATFARPAVFRGAVFEGESRHFERSAVFEDAAFAAEVDFDDAAFTGANFEGTRFGGVVDFAGATFDDVAFRAESSGGDVYVDFTDAVLREGTITQPEGTWTRYDLTRASVGDVSLTAAETDARRELLDYFRFCNTEFNEFDGYEFDFSTHTRYLDRNGWNLHDFDDPVADREYAMSMAPENVETTYLKAKNAASDGGYVKAAGEFRVQRQRYARRKHLGIARDRTASRRGRLGSASRAAENYFLDVTCGYGMRLGRIVGVFLLAPLFPALLYAFGGRSFLTGAGQLSSVGALATPAGQATFYENLHFSYITFLTIGYGGIGPVGALARLLAGLEVYLSVILGGLVLYALIKRSEL